MIVVGYQGIGKSTYARKHRGAIDLESSLFYTNGKRAEEWHIAYCQVAKALSEKGYLVFTSSHRKVREFFKENNCECVAVVPRPSLIHDWITKLTLRVIDEPSDKNKRALLNALDCYRENVLNIANDLPHYWIDNMDYDLHDIVGRFLPKCESEKPAVDDKAIRDEIMANLEKAMYVCNGLFVVGGDVARLIVYGETAKDSITFCNLQQDNDRNFFANPEMYHRETEKHHEFFFGDIKGEDEKEEAKTIEIRRDVEVEL